MTPPRQEADAAGGVANTIFALTGVIYGAATTVVVFGSVMAASVLLLG
jgi:hypothetical protein